MQKFYTVLFYMCISNCFLYSQVTLTADGPGNTYELITSVLAPGANPIEVPDCSHTAFGRHIEEVWDTDLSANVFAFHIHVSPDDDRCINFDRQRNEIKTYDQSPNNLKGVLGETVVYKWKFKLDAGFQPSSNFTHIHQIKAVGGSESSMPQITLTARSGNPEKLELRYAETTTQVTLATADLSLFKGEWVEATETITYGEPGSYDISIIKISDGSSLFSYSDPSIRMWKTNANFQRPKWGIYRSLLNSQQLIDEIIYFADFSIEETSNLNVFPTQLDFNADASSLTFTVNSNVNWVITENLSWLSLDVTSGFGTTTVTATVLENTTGTLRTGDIFIDESAGGSNLSVTLPITQATTFVGTGEVIITEYHNRPLKPTQTQLDAALPNNPTGADLTPNEGHTEWFELYNTTSSPVVMDGWTLTDASGSSNVTTIGTFTLPANSYAVFSGFDIPVAQGGVVFDYFYEYKKPSLNNESSYSDPGDTACPDGVIIKKANGTLVDEVLYDYGYGEYLGNPNSGSCSMNAVAIGIPPQGNASKISFMLNVDPAVMNSVDNDLAVNWSFSTLVYDAAGNQLGTPGLANDGSLPAGPSTGTGEVIITEIHNRPQKPLQSVLDAALPNNPSGADTTPDEGQTEWFEVYNTTNTPVVMDGWTLTDGSSSGNISTITSFTLPANSYAVFSGFNIPAAHGGIVFDYFYDYEKPSFNNESSYSDSGDSACPDGIVIKKADGTLVDEVLYDYGYGEYIGNSSSGNCSSNAAAIGIPPSGSSSRISMMLDVDPAIMNAADNDLAPNWSFSTLFYDPLTNQRGTPGEQNDQMAVACESDLILSGMNTTSGIKEAAFTVSSTEQIGAGVTVDYSAGTSITLDPGFEVILGAVFNAYILGCQ